MLVKLGECCVLGSVSDSLKLGPFVGGRYF